MRSLLAVCLLTLSATALAEERARIPAPIVFFDIAGPDAVALNAFYARVFEWEIAPNGAFSTPVVAPLPASTRATTDRDTPATVLYIGVNDVTARLKEVAQNGGTVSAQRFEIPGVVVLGLFKDPAGNLVGLVEMLDGKPKIP